MITTWQVLSDGTQTFTPIMTRVLDIANEFAQYLIYIWLWIIAVELIRIAVKYIIRYLEQKNKMAFYTYEDDVQGNWDGTFKIIRKWKRRNKIKWKYFKRFR